MLTCRVICLFATSHHHETVRRTAARPHCASTTVLPVHGRAVCQHGVGALRPMVSVRRSWRRCPRSAVVVRRLELSFASCPCVCPLHDGANARLQCSGLVLSPRTSAGPHANVVNAADVVVRLMLLTTHNPVRNHCPRSMTRGALPSVSLPFEGHPFTVGQ